MLSQLQTLGGEASSPFLRVLPDPAICHTSAIGLGESVARCEVMCPVTCRYATVSDKGYICKVCKNPNWMRFL